MANEIQNALGGLADILKGTGLRFYDYSVTPAPTEFPALVVVSLSWVPLVLGDASFEAVLAMRLYVSKAITQEAMHTAYEFCDPVGPKSIPAALETDRTWNNQIDTSRMRLVENIGEQATESGAVFIGADFTFEFTKQVTR